MEGDEEEEEEEKEKEKEKEEEEDRPSTTRIHETRTIYYDPLDMGVGSGDRGVGEDKGSRSGSRSGLEIDEKMMD